MANQMSDFDFLNRILNRNKLSSNQELMKEDKVAAGKHQQRVNIVRGRGVSAYALYEFGNKENREHLPFFNATFDDPVYPDAPKHLLALCDYIIIAECLQQTYVILVELKGGDKGHANAQVDGGKTFMEYVLKTAERIKDDNNMADFNAHNIQFRKVIVRQSKKEKLNSHLPRDKDFDVNGYINYETISKFDIREAINP